MSTHCQLARAKPGFDNSIPHSHRRTSRRFDPDIQHKRHRLPSEGRHVHPTLSTRAIKGVDTTGVEATVTRIRTRGGKA